MSHPARSLPDPDSAEGQSLVPTGGLPAGLPVIINARDILLPRTVEGSGAGLKFIDPSAITPATAQPLKKKEPTGQAAVLRGIKDLQQLQQQTIAVLETVKGTLDDIQQVLRSPEATRGMEKLQNAAMLLTKGFAREAVDQANGAVALLPANPDAHLLLSLSLAADQQFDSSLQMARKGLALFDRRQHPLAIEAGLLHALAALGCGAEAVDRWATIVDSLPLPVLFEQLERIAACFPAESTGGGEGLLDDLINRRVVRDEQQGAKETPLTRRQRLRDSGKVDLRPDEIPPETLFKGLDAAHEHHLNCTHRAILAQIARRLQWVKDAGDVVKFLGECVVPLGNRALDRSAGALGRASVKRLLKFQADAMTLHRAMAKLELAGAKHALLEVGTLMNHWRKAGNRVKRAHRALAASAFFLLGGVAILAYVVWFMNSGGAMTGKSTLLTIYGQTIDSLWIGPAMLGLGCIIGVYALLGRTWHVELPCNRPPLTAEELAYLNTAEMRSSLRIALA